MNQGRITFDEVFKIWLETEIESQQHNNILTVAKEKGFNSISEWRLNTALRLGLDKKSWRLEEIETPNEALPQIIVGPLKGWSQFFENKLETSFKDALEIPDFYKWCRTHDRILPIVAHFPATTTLILLQKPDENFIAIAGGHRICATAFAEKIDDPIDFTHRKVFACIAEVTEDELTNLQDFLAKGTDK